MSSPASVWDARVAEVGAGLKARRIFADLAGGASSQIKLVEEAHAAASRQLLPFFKRGELRVGPLLNGWLLDNKVADFTSFCPDDLFDVWDWFGIDTYESGTITNPGTRKPADRIPALVSYLQSRGQDLPIGVGEYNGHSAETIAAAGAAILGTPKVWFGCMWNATEGNGHTLEGERLAAFRRTLADARTAQAGQARRAYLNSGKRGLQAFLQAPLVAYGRCGLDAVTGLGAHGGHPR